MASSETAIANLALQRMGQALIDDINGTTVNESKVNNIFDQARDELLENGPENGWRFSRRTYHGIDREEFTITALADLVTGETTTVTATHTLVAGDMVTLSDTNIDGTYDVNSVSTTVSFAIDAVFTATDTGTANWTSERYAYRYAIPTSSTVLAVKVGGIELTDWIKEGGYILTNLESDTVDMDIVSSLTSTVTSWPAHFVRVLVLKLAIALHYSMTQDLKAIQLLAIELDLAMPKAIAMDERQKYVQESSQSWQEVGNTQEVNFGNKDPYFDRQNYRC